MGAANVYALGAVLYEMLAGVATAHGTDVAGRHRELADSTPHAVARHPQHSPARGGIGRRARPRKNTGPIGFPAPRHSRCAAGLRPRTPRRAREPAAASRAYGAGRRLALAAAYLLLRPSRRSLSGAPSRSRRSQASKSSPRCRPTASWSRMLPGPRVTCASSSARSWRRGRNDSALGRLDPRSKPIRAGRRTAAGCCFSRRAEPRSHPRSAGRRSQ